MSSSSAVQPTQTPRPMAAFTLDDSAQRQWWQVKAPLTTHIAMGPLQMGQWKTKFRAVSGWL